MAASINRPSCIVGGYQLDPVGRSMQMTRTDLLIADDFGLGDTIEAMSVVQKLRHADFLWHQIRLTSQKTGSTLTADGCVCRWPIRTE